MRWLLLACLVSCGGGAAMVSPDASGGGDGSPRALARRRCVDDTNRYRATRGKPPVVASPRLEAYADEGAMLDFGTAPHRHFSSTSGGGLAFAENECPQQGNWQYAPGEDLAAVVGACVEAFYAEGPGGGHYENLMGDHGALGCGMYDSGGKITIIQDFGD